MSALSAAQYHELLRQRFSTAGITPELIQKLWRFSRNCRGDPSFGTRLANALDSPAFSQPSALARAGYPAEAVAEAHRIALVIIERSLSAMQELTKGIGRTEGEAREHSSQEAGDAEVGPGAPRVGVEVAREGRDDV